MQSNVEHRKAMQVNAMQSNAKQCNAMQYKAKHCKAMESNAIAMHSGDRRRRAATSWPDRQCSSLTIDEET
eukprot:9491187-Pyramimonas_sp.AAC.1